MTMISEMFPQKYDRLGDFHEGLAQVRMQTIEEVIDTSGRVVVPCEDDAAGVS